MFYPVHIDTQTTPILLPLGRRRAVADQLLYLSAGSALLRLGPHEQVLRAGDLFWLPADCLHGLTLWQGACLSRIRFSLRVSGSRPSAAGFIHGDALLVATLQRLLTLPHPHDWQGHAGRLLRLLGDLLPEWQVHNHPQRALPAGLQTALQQLMQGQDLTAIANACLREQGLSPREVMDLFQHELGCSLIGWQEQWQLLQTQTLLRQGHSEEAAWRQAGLASAAQYQQCQQRYLAPSPLSARTSS